MANGHNSGFTTVAKEIREEAARQLRGFPREFKQQVTGLGQDAAHQLGSGWGREFARQIFGTPTSPSPWIVSTNASL